MSKYIPEKPVLSAFIRTIFQRLRKKTGKSVPADVRGQYIPSLHIYDALEYL